MNTFSTWIVKKVTEREMRRQTDGEISRNRNEKYVHCVIFFRNQTEYKKKPKDKLVLRINSRLGLLSDVEQSSAMPYPPVRVEFYQF